ncbi:MAG TPA: ParB N-terminal domain-containing protein [Pirellulales bacterium]|nr:ParB N-terminal domain-containing protein [Pirellulales bacterium]
MQPAVQHPEAIATELSISAGQTEFRPDAEYGVHPAATMFPLMHGVPLGELAADIAENGLIEPIVVYHGQILDGRNRLRACEMSEVEPRFTEWDGVGSPLAFVLARNLHRRHLNESQRAMIAARARELFEEEAAAREAAHQFGRLHENASTAGEDFKNLREITACANLHKPEMHANAEAAAMLNVSTRSVATAAKVLKEGDQKLIEAVDAGTVAVSDAAAVVDLPKRKQRRAVERVRSGRSRTVRQAARDDAAGEATEAPPEDSPAGLSSAEPDGAPLMTKLLRSECQTLSREIAKLAERVESLADAIGGHTLYTDRIRQGLALAIRATYEYLSLSGKSRG